MKEHHDMENHDEYEDDTVTVSFLRDFIRAQHRSYQQLQILAIILLLVLAFMTGLNGVTSFVNGDDLLGWTQFVVAVAMLATIVGWLVLLVQRTKLVREVIAAPISAEAFREDTAA